MKVSLLNYENDLWLAKDGNPNEWVVAYHGLRTARYLQSVLFGEDKKFSPKFKAGMGQKFKGSKDLNKKSDNFGKPSGFGTYFSANVTTAQHYTHTYRINDIKYKALLQCRINPANLRKPENSNGTYIVPNSEDIRPYGILIKTFI